MKPIIFLLIGIIAFRLPAQNKEGKIIYEETFRLDIQLDDETMERMKDMLPSSNKTKKVLLFNEQASLFKPVEGQDKETEVTSTEGDAHIKIVMAVPEDIVWYDLANKKITEQKEFMGKRFLINSEAEKPAWKITGEQKKVAGYNCIKAIWQDTAGNAEAWFAPEIPVSTGPFGFGQLPGIILEMSLKEGKTTISAISVEFTPPNVKEMIPPAKGEKVTEIEFKKIVEKKKKEMQEMNEGKGGNVMIKINR